MSVGARIRQFRTARGYTLDQLVGEMGGLVTKQAVSKYENDKAVPRPTVLVAIGRALDVRPTVLLSEPNYRFEMAGYRALAALPQGERESIENRVQVELEARLSLMDKLGMEPSFAFDGFGVCVTDVRDAEHAAFGLRAAWGLGGAPIANLAETLENQGVHLVTVDTGRKFDGLAVFAKDLDGRTVSCGMATRAETSRTRQRMSQSHETGHLAVELPESVDAEQFARRFGGAFLYPEAAVRAEFGSKRNRITTDELLAAKGRWGLSMQAVLFRLRDLEIIDEASYSWWCMRMNKSGWKTNEPGDEPPETSTWTLSHANRAAAEGLLSGEALAEYVPAARASRFPGDLDRRELMSLPLERRRELIRAQAAAIAEEYNASIDDQWLAGDIEDDEP